MESLSTPQVRVVSRWEAQSESCFFRTGRGAFVDRGTKLIKFILFQCTTLDFLSEGVRDPESIDPLGERQDALIGRINQKARESNLTDDKGTSFSAEGQQKLDHVLPSAEV